MIKENMTELHDIEKEKILLAFKTNLKLHIKNKNGLWRNGYVKKVEADFFIFNDRKYGIEPIFWLEVLKVEPFMEGRKLGSIEEEKTDSKKRINKEEEKKNGEK